MPRVWYAVPSARPGAEAQACFNAWRDMGYATAATRKSPDLELDRVFTMPEYPGLWCATNYLAKTILGDDPGAEIIVTGGDDVWPDRARTAEEAADDFTMHFKGTLGVMQPTGVVLKGHADTCWSPWLGREWCLRAFGGRGATEPAFWHYYGDAYLHAVAARLGLLWEFSSINHEHRNWKELKIARPPHLARSRDMWAHDKALYDKLVAAGFPGSELA